MKDGGRTGLRPSSGQEIVAGKHFGVNVSIILFFNLWDETDHTLLISVFK